MIAAENVAYTPGTEDGGDQMEARPDSRPTTLPVSSVDRSSFGAVEGSVFPVPHTPRIATWRLTTLGVVLSLGLHGLAIAGVVWLQSGRESGIEGTPQVVDVEVLTLSEFNTIIGGGGESAPPAVATTAPIQEKEPLHKAPTNVERAPEKPVEVTERKTQPRQPEEVSTKHIPIEKKNEPAPASQSQRDAVSGDAGESAPPQQSASTAASREGEQRGSSGGAGAGIPGPGSGDISRISYQDMVATRLARAKRYPERALRRHMTGEGRIRIVIAADGEVTDFQVVSSTNSEILDAELAAMVDRAAPFPPFPNDMTKTTLAVVVPVAFRLE
jgi:protein TonB